MKGAMKTKDEAALRGLRAIKAEIIKAKTEPGASKELNQEMEIKLLQKLVTMPGYTNYARLKLHPMWNPLRGNPRFEKIVASLAPKDESHTNK